MYKGINKVSIGPQKSATAVTLTGKELYGKYDFYQLEMNEKTFRSDKKVSFVR